MKKLSDTGRLVLWQQSGHDLVVQPRSRMAGGANLYLTHHGVQHLRQDRCPHLERKLDDPDTFTGEVGHDTDPDPLWRYHVELGVTEAHNFLTSQVILERKPMWPRSEPMPLTLGLMFRFATQDNFARLMVNGTELACTRDDYDHELHPLSAICMSDDIVVETACGRFVLTAVSGVDGIVLDTTVPERYFGVMLTGGGFDPIMVEPGGSTIQTTSVRFEPHLR